MNHFVVTITCKGSTQPQPPPPVSFFEEKKEIPGIKTNHIKSVMTPAKRDGGDSAVGSI